MIKNRQIKPLKTNEDLSKFKSSNKKINKYLNNQANINWKKGKSFTYLISINNENIGFFSLKKEKTENNNQALKIICFYICKNYRLKGIGTEILNDIQWCSKSNQQKINYIIADTYVESCMFYLKNGFDFYKINKTKKDKKNIITLYKNIENLYE